MDSFVNKLAVVTGGGSGMGRELVLQLAAEGCSVATCDLNPQSVTGTAEAARKVASGGAVVTAHTCDVADEGQVLTFRGEVLASYRTDHVDVLFNNAGIGGGGSFVSDPRDVWERTFAVDWWGVYHSARAFLPLLMAADEGLLVNTSSVNGFWASLGPGVPHTAYSTAKFAVRGFSEALIEDLRVHAPNVRVAVVMPGHIGTDIVANSRRAHGQPDPEDMTDEQLGDWRAQLGQAGADLDAASPDELRSRLRAASESFKNNAPLSAAEAASIILNALREGKWRILVGHDAETLDAFVRSEPERAYDPDRLATFRPLGG